MRKTKQSLFATLVLAYANMLCSAVLSLPQATGAGIALAEVAADDQ